MIKDYSQYLKQTKFLILFCLALITIEIFERQFTGLTTSFDVSTLIAFNFIFGLLLLFTTKSFKLIITFFLVLAYIAQSCHSALYGGWLNPTNLYLLSENFNEALGLITGIDKLVILKAFFFSLSSVLVLFFAYKHAKKQRGYLWVNIITILILIFQPIRDGIFTPQKIEKRATKDTHSLLQSFHNSYGVFLSLLISDLRGKQLYKDYRHPLYKVTASPLERPNIFIYFGESLSAEYMGIYNRIENTTPQLKAIINEEEFYVISKKTIAGAAATMPSSVRFFHMIKRPAGLKQAASFNTSLFKYAKKAKYQTNYISTQSEHTINHIFKLVAGKFVDQVLTPPLINKNLNKNSHASDKLVFKAMKQLKIKEPFFTVFQPNGSHTPFAINTSKETNKFTPGPELNNYKNTILFSDDITSKLIKLIDKQSTRPWVFIITSDHGTYVDKSRITRSLAYPASYTVPGLILTNSQSTYTKFLETYQDCQYLFHQNISHIIARLLNRNVPMEECSSGILFDGLLNGYNSKQVEILPSGRVQLQDNEIKNE